MGVYDVASGLVRAIAASCSEVPHGSPVFWSPSFICFVQPGLLRERYCLVRRISHQQNAKGTVLGYLGDALRHIEVGAAGIEICTTGIVLRTVWRCQRP